MKNIFICISKLQDQDPITENFLTSIAYCESIDELNELRIKIDHEIVHTRSNDKGGQNGMLNIVLFSLNFLS